MSFVNTPGPGPDRHTPSAPAPTAATVAPIRRWLQALADAAEHPEEPGFVPRLPAGIYLPERAAVLAQLPAQAHQFQSTHDLSRERIEEVIGDFLRSLSPNTSRAAIADLANLFAWCVDSGKDPLPPAAETVKAYIKARAGKGGAGVRPATVSRAIGTLGRILRDLRAHNVTEEPQVLNELAATRQHAKGKLTRQHSVAIRWEGERGIRAWLERPRGEETRAQQLHRLRAEAMILVGFWGALRVSELVAVRVEHLRPHPDGSGTLFLYDSKTHVGDETMKRELPRRAMAAVDAWLHAAGVSEGPVFRSFDPKTRPSARALTTTAANLLIKAAAEEMGVNTDLLRHQRSASSHGLRIGFVQEALSKDVSSDKVVLAGGWKSTAMVTLYARDLPSRDTGSAVLAKLVGE